MKAISILLLFSLAVSVLCQDMLPTPSGYFHRSCVHQIEDENVVLHPQDTGHVHLKYPNGSLDIIPPCNVTRKRAVELSDGWVVDAYYGADVFSSFTATWNVPTAPTGRNAQTIFTFTGLEGTYKENLYILQPVLQFGSSGAGGGYYWGIASWWAFGTSGFFSPLKAVSAGNIIAGAMVFNPRNTTWTVASVDTTSGARSVLNVHLTNTQTQYAYVALEVVNVASCSDYPTGTVNYENIVMSDGGKIPSWTPQVTSQCGETMTVHASNYISIKF